MSVNVSIKVDGENWSGDVDKLRTDVPGAGRKNWTPHEARRYISLTVPGMGVYYAEDYDAYGIAEIIVKKGAEIDAETYEYPDEYQPVAVSEGGRKYFFQVRGLRTNSNRWDPEERPLMSRTVYDYGAYYAKDEGVKGYRSVAVQIASQPKQKDPGYDYGYDGWDVPVSFTQNHEGTEITGYFGYNGELYAGDADFVECQFAVNGHTIGSDSYYDVTGFRRYPSFKGKAACLIPGSRIKVSPRVIHRHKPGIIDCGGGYWYTEPDGKTRRHFITEYCGEKVFWTSQRILYVTPPDKVGQWCDCHLAQSIAIPDSVRCAITVTVNEVLHYETGDIPVKTMNIFLASTGPFETSLETVITASYQGIIYTKTETEPIRITEPGYYDGLYTYTFNRTYRNNWEISKDYWTILTLPYDVNLISANGQLEWKHNATGIYAAQYYLARPDVRRLITVTYKRPIDDYEITKYFDLLELDTSMSYSPSLRYIGDSYEEENTN